MNKLTINQLNQSLAKEAQITTVTFHVFKSLHLNKGTKLEKMIASIRKVVQLTDGYEIHINNYNGSEKIIIVKFNGSVSINGSTFRQLVDAKSMHLRINHINNSIIIEKLIGICECILHDELPMSMRGLCVNVMDGSGNIITADELGIKTSYHPENLEWTLNYRNATHGRNIKKLFNITGKVYRYSANDDTLNQVLATKDSNKIKEYMKQNYVAVG